MDSKDLFRNKYCKIIVKGKNGEPMVFTGEILEYTDEKIVFIDKYHLPGSYASSEIIAITVKKGDRDGSI